MGQGRERLALLVLTALQMSHLLDFMVLTPLGPQLMRVFGITPTQVGLFVTVYTLSAALASLLSAFVIDRFDRKRALLWVYGGFLLSALASALAPSYALLLLARVLAGAFGGLLTGIVLAIVSDVVPEARRGRALGMVMSAFALSSIVFLPLCLWLGSHYSWRGAYGAVLLLGALAGPLAAWLLPSVRSHMASHAAARRIGGLFGQARQVLCDANHRRALLLAGLLNASSFALVPYLSPYLVLNAGVGEAELSLVYFTGGIGSLLAVHLSGRLADRMNRYRQFLIGAAFDGTDHFADHAMAALAAVGHAAGQPGCVHVFSGAQCAGHGADHRRCPGAGARQFHGLHGLHAACLDRAGIDAGWTDRGSVRQRCANALRLGRRDVGRHHPAVHVAGRPGAAGACSTNKCGGAAKLI